MIRRTLLRQSGAIRAVRGYATESVSVTEQPPPTPKAAPENVYAGLILSRRPIVTPDLTDFEKAYYKYQDELERRLMWTFPQYFYYKKGSLSERRFVAHQRGPVVRHPGVIYEQGLPDIKFNRERRFKQEIVVPKEGGDEGSESSFTRPIAPNSRKTEADEKNDTKSLIRQLDRTLYLAIKKENEWAFPTFDLLAKEPLHIAAERGLRELGGPNMHTWTVSNTPAAMFRRDPARDFFVKSHIIHGQFTPQDKKVDFAWLTKEELGDKFAPKYYKVLEPVLSNQ
ncbi:large ribosomal subunit protein mL46 [Trichomonascus vanleenenianus]|uniref:mitochondrial 54S ribosomal protein mL46 MRPL17 n=1 Tax=Trichomonascus vanleenenianus TaxID=2268995 RepID=UPI003EC99B19